MASGGNEATTLLPVASGKSGDERIAYFVECVARSQVLWIAESDESTLTCFDEAGRESLPVWPSEQDVIKSLPPERKAEGFRGVAVTLARWRSKSTPALIKMRCLVGVFPDDEMSSALVSVTDLNPEIDVAMKRLAAGPVLQGTDIARLKRRVAKEREGRSSKDAGHS